MLLRIPPIRLQLTPAQTLNLSGCFWRGLPL